MAAATLPPPDTTYGPCAACEHRDCACTRAMAASACGACGEPIGYGARFLANGDPPELALQGDSAAWAGRLAHESCVLAELDREPAPRPVPPSQTRWTCPHCGTSGWWTPSTHIGPRPMNDHDRPDGRRCLASKSWSSVCVARVWSITRRRNTARAWSRRRR